MKEYLDLKSIVKNGSSITDVQENDNLVYFRIDGHLFQTASGMVHHENSPLFDTPFVKYQGYINHDPEGIIEHEESMDNTKMVKFINKYFTFSFDDAGTRMLKSVDKYS